MNCWLLEPNYDSYKVYKAEREQDYDNISACFNGVSLKEDWLPALVTVDIEGNENDCAPGLPLGTLMLSEHAANMLDDFIQGKVELLPLRIANEETHYALNVLNILNCIDEENAEVKRYRDGRFMKYTKHAFYEDFIIGEHIFKIVDHEANIVTNGSIFVSDEFKQAVQAAGLKGFQFTKVWSTEPQPEAINEFEKDETSMKFGLGDVYMFILQGVTVASENWAIRLGQEQDIQVAELKEDGSYQWIRIIYFPQKFIDMEWQIAKI